MRHFWIMATAALLAAAASAQERVPEVDRLRVGVVDIAKVFDGYAKRTDREKELRAEEERLEKEYNDRKEKLRQIRNELDLLREGSLTYMLKKEEQTAAASALNYFDQIRREILKSRFETYMLEILTEIEQVVQEIGKKGGYHFIIKVDNPANTKKESTTPLELRAVLYYSNEIDISNQVLDILNDKYRKSGGGQ